jgi:hypothetical protein
VGREDRLPRDLLRDRREDSPKALCC